MLEGPEFSAELVSTQMRKEPQTKALFKDERLERSRIGRVERFTRSGKTGIHCFRFGFAAVELTHDIGANAPERLLVGLGFLAFAVSAFVRRANEAALDENVRTFLDCRRDVFGEPWAEHTNAVPLGLRRPFVVGVLPRPLRGDGKYDELRAVVVPRLTLLRVCTDEADDRH
jgi:hypothetical protein